MRPTRTHLSWLLFTSLLLLLAAPAIASATVVKMYVYGPGQMELWGPSEGAPDVRCTSPESTPTGTVGAVCESPNYGFGQSITIFSRPPFSHYGTPGNQCASVREQTCYFTVWGVGTATVHAYFVDKHPPETSITRSPIGTLTTTSTDIAFRSSQDGSTFECKLDNGSWSACASPQTFAGLSQGSHTVYVAATDASGNRDDSPASATFTVDSVPPTITALEGPYGWARGRGTFTFASEAGAKFWCRSNAVGRGDSGFEPCTSGIEIPSLRDGAQLFEIKASDAAGNTSGVSEWRWGSDTGSPMVQFTGGVGGGQTITTRSADLVWEITDTSGTTVTCALDGAALPCSSRTTQRLDELTEGRHEFAVTARDSVGLSTSASTAFYIDTVAPTAQITAGPADGSSTTDRDATFEFGSGEAHTTMLCSLDDAEFTRCTSPRTFMGLSVGEHTLRVRAVDTHGNDQPVETADRRTWRVVDPPPAPTPIDTTGGTTGGGTGDTDSGTVPAPGSTNPGGAATPPADTTAPVVLLKIAKRVRVTAKTTRIAVQVRCSEACTVKLGTTARAGKRSVRVAPVTARLVAGRTTVVWVTVPKALRALTTRGTAVRLTLSAVARDAVGNASKRTAVAVARR